MNKKYNKKIENNFLRIQLDYDDEHVCIFITDKNHIIDDKETHFESVEITKDILINYGLDIISFIRLFEATELGKSIDNTSDKLIVWINKETKEFLDFDIKFIPNDDIIEIS